MSAEPGSLHAVLPGLNAISVPQNSPLTRIPPDHASRSGRQFHSCVVNARPQRAPRPTMAATVTAAVEKAQQATKKLFGLFDGEQSADVSELFRRLTEDSTEDEAKPAAKATVKPR